VRRATLHASAAFVAVAPLFSALSGCADAPPPAATPASPRAAAAAAITVNPFRGATPAPVAKKAEAAPIQLTASDGTGLRLTSLAARAVVEAPLAFTEIKLTFQNPEDRVLEGNFSVTLPPGASISRFAMRIGDLWQEGEVVERTRARAAYEDFLHRRQDPAAAWIKAEPARRAEILAKARKAGGAVEDAPSLRFVLNWETDANDVDFHIRDDRGNHAYYSTPSLPGGGELYADVTTGYGPECFTVRAPRDQRAARYTLQAHYYARGPMGYGMGKLEVIEHDGQGGLTFEERPFVVMNDQAFVDLGAVTR
jgi:Vault protein inter-alpha-trypsin domain